MSKETCFRCNRPLAQVERAIGHTCKPTPEYCDKIEVDRDAALAMVRELREALAPFAKFGKKLNGRRGTPVSGDWCSLDSGSEDEASITIEDFNGAINSLAKAEALHG